MKQISQRAYPFTRRDGSQGTLFETIAVYDGNILDFEDWVQFRTGNTPREIYTYMLATGPYKDYNAAMEYLRRQYRAELQEQRELIYNNPFKEEIFYGNDNEF